MGKYDDLVAQLREDGMDDLADEFDQFKATSLRQKAAQADELQAKLDEANSRLADLELAPKREQAFKNYGVDLENLRPAEKEAVKGFKFAGQEPTAEEVAAFVERYDLPLAQGVREERTPPASGQIAGQARTSGMQSVGGKTTITPEDAQEWSTEKILRFREKHPEEFEQLKRGETVTVAVS